MARLSRGILLIISVLVLTASIVFAEDITITTYYPSPYGSYRELRSQRMAIGDNYINGVNYTWEAADGDGGEVDYLSDLVVEGNVGIGTANPTAKLHVNGNIKAVLNDIDGGSPANMRYNSGTNEVGFDVAELFEANQEVEPGDVLSIDDNGRLKKSSLAYDTKVAGVVSGAPAILFEGSQLQIAPQPFEFKKGNKPPLALAGRIKCKATNQGGEIKIGDLLVASSKPGYAMRGEPDKIRFGTVLGKALEPLDEKEGVILVLVTL